MSAAPLHAARAPAGPMYESCVIRAMLSSADAGRIAARRSREHSAGWADALRRPRLELAIPSLLVSTTTSRKTAVLLGVIGSSAGSKSALAAEWQL